MLKEGPTCPVLDSSVQYRINGRSRDDGFDCWQFFRFYHAERGIVIPDVKYDETNYLQSLADCLSAPERMGFAPAESPEDGDLVVLNLAGQDHCGVYERYSVLTMTDKGLRTIRWNRAVAFVRQVLRHRSNTA